MKNFFKITVPVSIICLILAEIILRFMPVSDPYSYLRLTSVQYIPSQFEPNVVYHLESAEGLPFVDSSSIFSTNNYGFRGDELKEPKEPGKYRIFLIGGSTTEGMYIDDKKSMNSLIQDYLSDMNAEVFNAGKSGDKLPDHISMLAHRIVQLQPDMVVLFCGLNDLRQNSYDYKHRFIKTSGKNLYHWYDDSKMFLSNFQIYRRLYNIFKRPGVENITFRSDYKSKTKYLQSLPVSNKIPELNLPAYEICLKTFAGICRENNIGLVFVTQASTWDSQADPAVISRHWMSFIGSERFPEDIMNKGLESYNDVIRSVAAGSGVLLYDLSKEIPRTSKYFFDDCHFNNNGVEFFARGVSEIIRKNVQP
jgi:lysophospholipase L1-like esterase